MSGVRIRPQVAAHGFSMQIAVAVSFAVAVEHGFEALEGVQLRPSSPPDDRFALPE
jgi:hypothetical protein